MGAVQERQRRRSLELGAWKDPHPRVPLSSLSAEEGSEMLIEMRLQGGGG
jgi:hypothetical protein